MSTVAKFPSGLINEGIRIVRKVVADTPSSTGFTTAEIFKLATKVEPSEAFRRRVLPTLRTPALPYLSKDIQQIPYPVPPFPEHPIRSMTFLKRTILPILEGNCELKMGRTTRVLEAGAPHSIIKGKRKSKEAPTSSSAPTPVTVWAWQTVDRSTLPTPRKPKQEQPILGTEVGVAQDWSHLNKRRRRARALKVRADFATMLAEERAEKARKKAAKSGSAPPRVNASISKSSTNVQKPNSN